MSLELHRLSAKGKTYDALDGVDDSLVEKVWLDLDRQLPRERVSRVVDEVALGFQNATVKTFLPILVHRRALERLRQELDQTDTADSRLLDERQ